MIKKLFRNFRLWLVDIKGEEGISLSMLECMACAVPVIATPMEEQQRRKYKNGIIIETKILRKVCSNGKY